MDWLSYQFSPLTSMVVLSFLCKKARLRLIHLSLLANRLMFFSLRYPNYQQNVDEKVSLSHRSVLDDI